jgi:6-phosphogluconate dehydrogenase
MQRPRVDQVAIDEGVPAPVLLERFASRSERELADRVISAIRSAFGGHPEPGA